MFFFFVDIFDIVKTNRLRLLPLFYRFERSSFHNFWINVTFEMRFSSSGNDEFSMTKTSWSYVFQKSILCRNVILAPMKHWKSVTFPAWYRPIPTYWLSSSTAKQAIGMPHCPVLRRYLTFFWKILHLLRAKSNDRNSQESRWFISRIEAIQLF